MKSLSIIVPMYNIESYIKRCLQSLEDQDISKDDYEVICINDGSPDNCSEIVIRLQKEFDNIILINQENQGVSVARNKGIDRARGKYVLFIDPDDYVDANCFGSILKNAEREEPQVYFLGFTFLKEDGTIRKQVLNETHAFKRYMGIDTYFFARGDGRTDPDRMVAVLFETEFINSNGLRYLPDVPFLEDGELIARILCIAERCIFDGHSFYQRTTRPDSATNSRLFNSEKAINGFLLAANNLKRFQQEQNLDEKQKKFLNQPIVKFVLLAIHSSIGCKINKRFSATVRALEELSLQRIDLVGCNRIYSLYGKAYNLSPYMAALTLILYPRINRLLQLNKIRKNTLTK